MKLILSIDGGGIRGLIPAVFLSRVEVALGKPLWSVFDLAAGTSTGGILVCGAAARLSAALAPDIYLAEREHIFYRSRLYSLRTLNGWRFGPKYDGSGLRAVLRDYLGAASLADAPFEILVAAQDRRAPHGQKAYFFKRRKAREDAAHSFALWQVAYATSAAPAYFPPLTTATQELIDGGVHSRNPAMAAVAEALRLWPGEPIRLLSLGTGVAPERFASSVRWGRTEWAAHIINEILDGDAGVDAYQARQVLSESSVLSEGSYLRLDPELSRAVAMDATSASDMRVLLEAEQTLGVDFGAKQVADFLLR